MMPIQFFTSFAALETSLAVSFGMIDAELFCEAIVKSRIPIKNVSLENSIVFFNELTTQAQSQELMFNLTKAQEESPTGSRFSVTITSDDKVSNASLDFDLNLYNYKKNLIQNSWFLHDVYDVRRNRIKYTGAPFLIYNPHNCTDSDYTVIRLGKINRHNYISKTNPYRNIVISRQNLSIKMPEGINDLESGKIKSSENQILPEAIEQEWVLLNHEILNIEPADVRSEPIDVTAKQMNKLTI
jgi:hypothetical protein